MGNIHPEWYNGMCSGFSLISLLMPGAGTHMFTATAEEARVWSAACVRCGRHHVAETCTLKTPVQKQAGTQKRDDATLLDEMQREALLCFTQSLKVQAEHESLQPVTNYIDTNMGLEANIND